MAYKVFHRSVTAGVALAGAGAITFAAVPVLPAEQVVATTPRVVTAEVATVASTNYVQILAEAAVATLVDSIDALQTDSPALFAQVAAQWADADYLPWNHSMVLSALLAPAAPLVVGPFTDAVVDVVADQFHGREDEVRAQLTESIDYAVARLVGPLLGAMGGTGAAHQQIYWAGVAGDYDRRNLAILTAPLHVIDGFLNGGYGDLGPLITGEASGPRIPAPGLLTPWGEYPEDRNVQTQDEAWSPLGQADELETDTTVLDKTVAEEQIAEKAITVAELEEATEPTGATEETEVTNRVSRLGLRPAVEESTTHETTKRTRPSIRQGLKDLRKNFRDSVKNLTGAPRDSEAADTSKGDDAPKATNAGKTKKTTEAGKTKEADKSSGETD